MLIVTKLLQTDSLQVNNSLLQVSVPSSMGLASGENSSDPISKAAMLEPQPANAASAQPSQVASAQPAPVAILQTAPVSKHGKDQQSGSGQQTASGGSGPGGQVDMPAHLQQVGSQQMGPLGLIGQESAWISRVWHPGIGVAQGASQLALQRSSLDWDAFPEGVSQKAYMESAEPLGSLLKAALKVKIGKGEYVDVFSVCCMEPEPKLVQQWVIVIKEQEQFRHPKVASTWNSCFPAF